MIGRLQSAGFIARKDLSYTLRQRETILWTFVMPIIFFYFIGTVTGGFGSPGGSEDAPDPIAVRIPAEGGVLADQIVGRLEGQNFAIRRPATDPEFSAARRRLTIPEPPAGYPDLTAAVLDGESVSLRFERRGDDPAARFDEIRVQRAVLTVLADLVVLVERGQEPTSDAFRALAAMPRSLSLRVEAAGAREEAPEGFAQAIPGTMVMFTMLVLLTSGAILLVIERNRGLLRRLASTPIPRGAVVTGKWVGKMALGLVQIGFAMLAGTLLFGMDWGDALGMVALVLAAWAAFNASLGILLGNLARTEAQVGAIGVLVTMALAALGGAWWPIEITPDWMQALAMGIPTGWAMDAMHRLVNFGYGASSALPHVVALGTGAVVLGWIGTRTFRYQ